MRLSDPIFWWSIINRSLRSGYTTTTIKQILWRPVVIAELYIFYCLFDLGLLVRIFLIPRMITAKIRNGMIPGTRAIVAAAMAPWPMSLLILMRSCEPSLGAISWASSRKIWFLKNLPLTNGRKLKTFDSILAKSCGKYLFFTLNTFLSKNA